MVRWSGKDVLPALQQERIASDSNAPGLRIAQDLGDATSSFPYLEARAGASAEHHAGGRYGRTIIRTVNILMRQNAEGSVDEIAAIGLHASNLRRRRGDGLDGPPAEGAF